MHMTGRDSVILRDCPAGTFIHPDRPNFLRCKKGVGVAFSTWGTAVLMVVRHVFQVSAPSEIVRTIIGLVSIKVPDLITGRWTGAMKG